MKKMFFWMLAASMLTFGISGCNKDDDNDVVIKARFSITNDEYDGFKIILHNDSENATSYEWDFGDGQPVGTQSDTVFSYTYAQAGTYTITLTAKNGSKVVTSHKEVTISGMTFKQFLAGTSLSGKIWRLEYEVGVAMLNPDNYSDLWYSWSKIHGLPVDQRNSVRHHEYIFKPDGNFEFITNGYTIRPGFLFGDAPESKGWSDEVSWMSSDNTDCSTWGSNANLTFEIQTASYYSDCKFGRIVLKGKGGHIGPMDSGTEKVVDDPATETFYEVYHYADGGDQPDTLVLFTPWGGNENGVGNNRGSQIGRVTLVAYKSDAQIPADEVEVVVDKPLEVHDIYDNFDTDGTMAWVEDNSPALFDKHFVNPDKSGINTSDTVAKYVRGTMDYANLQFELSYRMDLSTRNVFKMKVYIDPAAVVKTVSLKLQNSKEGGNAWQTQTEKKIQDIETGKWVELTFDFSDVSTNTDYDKIVLQFGDEGSNKGDGTFYFDDFALQ